jgi:low affinity Fe/Cu permease
MYRLAPARRARGTALHLKLHEFIRVSESARNRLLDLEGLSDAELERLRRVSPD